MNPLDEQPILLDESKINEILTNLVKVQTGTDGTMEFITIIYDEELYRHDVDSGELLDSKFPTFRTNLTDGFEDIKPTYDITKIFGYDAIMKGKMVIITEYHIPTHSHFVKPCKYSYDIKDPLFYKISENSENIGADIPPKDKAFVKELFNQNINNPESQYEKYAISEKDYWRNEKEYLANEEEDFPFFIASLLSSYGADKIILDATPRTSAYDILFCHLIKSTKQVSAITFLSEMQELYEKGFISCPFSENTFTRALSSSNARKVLQDLLALSVQPFVGIDKEFAIDSSGFTTVAYSQWYKRKYPTVSKDAIGKKRQSEKTAKIKEEIRMEKEYVRKPWLKASIVIGRTTHAVFSLDVTNSHGKGTGDTSRFEKTVKDASKYFIHEDSLLTADKIYNTKRSYDVAESLGFKFICDFKRNSKGTTDCHAMNMAYHFKFAHPNIFHYFYGGRNNVESVFNAIKVKVGERVFANSEEAIYNEMYCKMIAYNILALIRLYYMCGIQIEFNEIR